MKIFTYITVIVSVLLLNACKQEDISSYEQDPRVYFRIPSEFDNKISRDSLVYSFPFNPAITDQDTIWYEATIMGNALPTDREFDFQIDTTGTTAKENVDFKLIKTVIPAGTFKARVPIVIYKTAEIKTKSLRLQLNVQENQNFKVGYTRYEKAVFVWADKFLKPDIWIPGSQYESAFGGFSQAKMKFILETLKITKLPDPNNRDLLGWYNQQLRYSLSVKPVKDDNGFNMFIPVYGTPGLG
jgi:hypothetical protein